MTGSPDPYSASSRRTISPWRSSCSAPPTSAAATSARPRLPVVLAKLADTKAAFATGARRVGSRGRRAKQIAVDVRVVMLGLAMLTTQPGECRARGPAHIPGGALWSPFRRIYLVVKEGS